MASITIRGLDATLVARLRLRAALNDRSMEEEAREILLSAIATPDRRIKGLGTAIHRRFREVGGVELELPARNPWPPR